MLNKSHHPSRDRLAEVDRLLAASAPMRSPSPQLRSRIMHSLRESAAPAPMRLSWAYAAAACLALGLISIPVFRSILAPAPAKTTPDIAALNIPVGAAPMLRLVAGTFDKPMMDQARKIYDDTKRATRAIVECVPFAARGI